MKPASTVEGYRYSAMIIEYLMSESETRDLGDLWYQQDDATSHTVH